MQSAVAAGQHRAPPGASWPRQALRIVEGHVGREAAPCGRRCGERVEGEQDLRGRRKPALLLAVRLRPILPRDERSPWEHGADEAAPCRRVALHGRAGRPHARGCCLAVGAVARAALGAVLDGRDHVAARCGQRLGHGNARKILVRVLLPLAHLLPLLLIEHPLKLLKLLKLLLVVLLLLVLLLRLRKRRLLLCQSMRRLLLLLLLLRKSRLLLRKLLLLLELLLVLLKMLPLLVLLLKVLPLLLLLPVAQVAALLLLRVGKGGDGGRRR